MKELKTSSKESRAGCLSGTVFLACLFISIGVGVITLGVGGGLVGAGIGFIVGQLLAQFIFERATSE